MNTCHQTRSRDCIVEKENLASDGRGRKQLYGPWLQAFIPTVCIRKTQEKVPYGDYNVKDKDGSKMKLDMGFS